MKYHAINPYAASLFPMAVFLIAFFFPNSTWKAVLYEDDVVQYNWGVFFFVALCNIFLYIGISLGSRFWYFGPRLRKNVASLYIRVMPVITVTAVVLIFFINYLASNYPGYLLLTVSGQANIAKQMLIDNEIKYTTLIHYAIPVVLWAFYRHLEAKSLYKTCRLVSYFTCLGVVLILMIAFVNAARYLILPIVLGLFVIHAKLRKYDQISFDKHLSASFRSYALLICSVVVIFCVFSFLRGSEDVSEIYSSILGYGPVSYNRLAMQLQGKLAFDFSGSGTYIVPDPFLSILRTVAGFSPLSGNEIWNSEFNSVRKVGLNADFIWLTVYGYTYDSIGYLAPIYFLIFGIFSGASWRAFLGGRVFGIVFYPFVFFSIFFFFGSNYLAAYFQYYLIVFCLLSCYEWFVSLAVPGYI